MVGLAPALAAPLTFLAPSLSSLGVEPNSVAVARRRDRPHASKLSRELGWQPAEKFESGLRKTVRWYLDHFSWVESVRTGAYLDWIKENYTERVAL